MSKQTPADTEAMLETARKLSLATPPDEKQAFKLLKRARRQGSTEAAYAIATWYLHGRHVAQDVAKGNELLREIASSHGAAAYDLAVSYELGIGLKKNKAKAFEYYLRSAAAGDKLGAYEVYRCYLDGIGTELNPKLARIWRRIAAEKLGADRFEKLGRERAMRHPSRIVPRMRKARNQAAADGERNRSRIAACHRFQDDRAIGARECDSGAA